MSTFYRITNCMFGTMNGQQDKLAPGSYWTPRWDAIVSMMTSSFLYSVKNKFFNWNTTVYQVNNAIMTEPPPEHGWAKSNADVGEQILVKLTELPTIAVDPITKIEINNLDPQSMEFMKIINYNPPSEFINYPQHSVNVSFNNQDLLLFPNYKRKSLQLVKQLSSWQFQIVLEINSINHWNILEKQIIIQSDNELLTGLAYFFKDMSEDSPLWIERN